MRLPRIFWIFILVVSIAYFGYSAYMFVWRSYFCLRLTNTQVNTLISDMDDYLTRRIIYRKVCSGGPGFLPIIISSVGMYYGFMGWLYSYVHEAKKKKLTS